MTSSKLLTLMAAALMLSCQAPEPQSDDTAQAIPAAEPQEIVSEYYTLRSPSGPVETLVILFPGLGGNAARIDAESEIPELALAEDMAVASMNMNQNLWLYPEDYQQLDKWLTEIIAQLPNQPEQVVIGGFSAGGMVTMLWSSHLLKSNNEHAPTHAFVVDAPIDLVVLYENLSADLEEDYPDWRLQEPRWLVNHVETAFGSGDSIWSALEDYSIYTHRHRNISNVAPLQDIDLRIYTEPDTLWWQENRMMTYEETNSHIIDQFEATAKEEGWKKLEVIRTVNRGYRQTEGTRHPHSWSIVDANELLSWIKP